MNRSTRTGVRRTWPMAKLMAVVAAVTMGAGLLATPASAAIVAVPSTGGSAAGVALTNGSMYNVVDQIGARAMWANGYTGTGVNVAIIDTGVSAVTPLLGADKVVAMVDLSPEAAAPETAYRDTFGHGTHMVGIIAGRDPGADPKTAALHPEWFMGVAPDAGIVSVKVADSSGATDVSQVIAGVDWVVEHAAELNIRVLNLSYDSGSYLPYTTDPLTYAVERAWKAGIVVVAAVGNDGRNAQSLGTPAVDPYVIAVAAGELKNSGSWKVPMWVTRGDGVRDPDITAPGTSIVSLRAPGSRIDVEHPEGYVSPSLFKGSGSSQAAAVVSGAAALLIGARPTLTPDQVKKLLRSTANAKFMAQIDPSKSGQGLIQVDKAFAKATPTKVQNWPMSDGSGLLEASRGGNHVIINGQPLTGEVTVLGNAWEGIRWAGIRWAGGTWDGIRWAGATWTGIRWADASWTGIRWAGDTWTGIRWAGIRWAGTSWSASTWTGVGFEGIRWAEASWS